MASPRGWQAKEWVITILTAITLSISGLVYKSMATEIGETRAEISRHKSETAGQSEKIDHLAASLNRVEDQASEISRQIHELKNLLISENLRAKERGDAAARDRASRPSVPNGKSPR